TQKLLAAFASPVMTGVVVGVCGVSGCSHPTVSTPSSSSSVTTPQRSTPEYSEADIESAAEAILGVLPGQRTANSSWMTREALGKKLPTINSALLDQALALLKEDGQIRVFDDSGTLRYSKPESRRG